ncbi:MAG: hypothetical protein ABI040_10570, partial [Rhodoferax sp.]
MNPFTGSAERFHSSLFAGTVPDSPFNRKSRKPGALGAAPGFWQPHEDCNCANAWYRLYQNGTTGW